MSHQSYGLNRRGANCPDASCPGTIWCSTSAPILTPISGSKRNFFIVVVLIVLVDLANFHQKVFSLVQQPTTRGRRFGGSTTQPRNLVRALALYFNMLIDGVLWRFSKLILILPPEIHNTPMHSILSHK